MLSRGLVILSVFLLILGCIPSTKTDSPSYQEVRVESDIRTYEVEGVGDEYFSARRDAIKNGIIKGVIDIVGRDRYNANSDVIAREILDNRKIVGEISEFNSTHIFDRDGKKVVKGVVRVNLKSLKEHVDKLNLQTTASVVSPQPKSSITQTRVERDIDTPSQVEQVSISKDSPLYNISFLVFIPDEKVSLLDSQEEYKMLIEAINSKLSDLGLDYIDLNRIRDLSKKFTLIYEEKSGQSMSIAQMMAQDVKANVYIEADIDIKYDFVAGNNVSILLVGSLKAYDSSTGRGLGVVSFSRPKKTSRGMFVAKTEGISEVVSIDLIKLLKNVEDYYSKGIKIDISIIGFKSLTEEKEFSTILDTLPGLSSKKRKSISGNVAEYEIVYKGGASVFVDDLIDVVSTHPKYSKISIDQGANRVIIKIK